MTDTATRLERLLVALTHSRWVHASSGAHTAPSADMPEFLDEIRTFVERVVDEDASDLFAHYTQGRLLRTLGYLGTLDDLSISPLETPRKRWICWPRPRR